MNSVQSNNAPKSNYAVKPNPQYANYAVNTVRAKKPINKKKLISIIISVIVVIAIASGGIWHLEDYIPYYDPNISFGGSLLDSSGNIISSSDGSSVKIELENLNNAIKSKADYYYDLYFSE